MDRQRSLITHARRGHRGGHRRCERHGTTHVECTRQQTGPSFRQSSPSRINVPERSQNRTLGFAGFLGIAWGIASRAAPTKTRLASQPARPRTFETRTAAHADERHGSFQCGSPGRLGPKLARADDRTRTPTAGWPVVTASTGSVRDGPPHSNGGTGRTSRLVSSLQGLGPAHGVRTVNDDPGVASDRE